MNYYEWLFQGNTSQYYLKLTPQSSIKAHSKTILMTNEEGEGEKHSLFNFKGVRKSSSGSKHHCPLQLYETRIYFLELNLFTPMKIQSNIKSNCLLKFSADWIKNCIEQKKELESWAHAHWSRILAINKR